MLADEGAAIEVVYASHWARLARELTSITRDADDGSELAAEAFARFSHEVAAGRAPDNPGAWLRRVGTNLASSRGRHRKVHVRRLGELPRPPDPPAPEAMAILAETCQELGQAMVGLAAPERQALSLAARGYDATEIGAALGRTPGATRTLLCRTRAKLRHRLEAAGVVVASWLVWLASDGWLEALALA